MIGFGVANLFSGDYYGIPTRLPWGVDLWGALRHPTQIYLTLAALGTWLALRRLDANKHLQRGMLIQVFALLMGVSVLLIEPLRADSPVIAAGIRTMQVAALIAIVGALAGFAARAPVEEPEAA
jgi:prolipoprotein diacylglyceryltransferase